MSKTRLALRRRAEAAGVADRVTIRKLLCSPFPFEDGSLDLVFLRDSIIHIPDKAALVGALASPTSYRRAMDKAGFVDVELDNRDSWYQEEAAKRHCRMSVCA